MIVLVAGQACGVVANTVAMLTSPARRRIVITLFLEQAARSPQVITGFAAAG